MQFGVSYFGVRNPQHFQCDEVFTQTMQALRSCLPALSLYARSASGVPRRGLFIGMGHLEEQVLCKGTGS